jgi:hypothetical protein
MPTPNEAELTALRKRFLDDFEFWAKHGCFIRTKQGKIAPLVLNHVQRRFVKRVIAQLTASGKVRMIVLKARQQGFSTVISAIQYWWLSQHPAQKGLVMAHEADSTTTLFDMYRRIHDNVPDMLRPSTKYSSRTELVFDKLDTALRVATAGGRGVARGETLTFTHLSEVAFWPANFAAANFNGLIQAVPEEPGTFVFIESTANGLTGMYYAQWSNAVKGENGYEAFFSAWVESSEYQTPIPATRLPFERTPEELEIARITLKLYGITVTDEQLFWRRRKISNTSLELFMQEYPLTADEAFISTGRPVFNTELVTRILTEVGPPILEMAEENGVMREAVRGEMKVYREKSEHETYTIGADVGMGVRKGDPSVAQVFDGQKRQVAVWRGLVDPDRFAYILKAIGLYYNTAMIAPERNNHGLLTCVRLGRDLNYPNVFTDVTEGALEDKDSINIGFLTNVRTKPLIIDKLRASLRYGEIELNDETTLREMLSFVVNDNGQLEAEPGCHDDCVMALAICNHIHEGKFEPVLVTEDFYSYAI